MDVNEDDLRNLFYVCGEIDKVHVFRYLNEFWDREELLCLLNRDYWIAFLTNSFQFFRDPHTGEHKGFGFIHFKTREAQQKALSEFNNYMIKVSKI